MRSIIIKKLLKKLVRRKKHRSHQPKIIPRSEHTISRASISPQALKVLYRLKEAGFKAYLVGGCVRDLLLGYKPKDFDVATDAHPEQVRKLFSNCRLIGRRFRLAHVHFGRDIIEVATFRAPHLEESEHAKRSHHGMILRDNVYGTIEDDAWRRDFTINALYYNIADFSLVDYCHGKADIDRKMICIIGDPGERYREDPIRILRAIRFAGKLGFAIEPNTEAPIFHAKELLLHVPPSRLFDEILKLFQSGHSLDTYELLKKYHVFELLFQQTFALFTDPEYSYTEALIKRAFANTDQRVQSGKHINPAFLFTVILWYPLQKKMQELIVEGYTFHAAWEEAMSRVLNAQLKQVAIPKRLTAIVREMWQLQPRLEKRAAKRVYQLLEQPRFRAAYDLLLLRAAAGEEVNDIAAWWTTFQDSSAEERKTLLASLPDKPVKKIRRRKKRKAAS